MSVKKMQGISAYIEYIGTIGEKRPHKECKYYDEGICKCYSAASLGCKCYSANFCDYYQKTDVMVK